MAAYDVGHWTMWLENTQQPMSQVEILYFHILFDNIVKKIQKNIQTSYIVCQNETLRMCARDTRNEHTPLSFSLRVYMLKMLITVLNRVFMFKTFYFINTLENRHISVKFRPLHISNRCDDIELLYRIV